jgi:hypothetical protein
VTKYADNKISLKQIDEDLDERSSSSNDHDGNDIFDEENADENEANKVVVTDECDPGLD